MKKTSQKNLRTSHTIGVIANARNLGGNLNEEIILGQAFVGSKRFSNSQILDKENREPEVFLLQAFFCH